MMEIQNAYIVHIDFDGDIASEYSNGRWKVFTGNDALAEVKATIVNALTDLMHHELLNNPTPKIYIDDDAYPIQEVVTNDQLLEMYIEYGGSDIGNWEISIYNTNRF